MSDKEMIARIKRRMDVDAAVLKAAEKWYDTGHTSDLTHAISERRIVVAEHEAIFGKEGGEG